MTNKQIEILTNLTKLEVMNLCAAGMTYEAAVAKACETAREKMHNAIRAYRASK